MTEIEIKNDEYNIKDEISKVEKQMVEFFNELPKYDPVNYLLDNIPNPGEARYIQTSENLVMSMRRDDYENILNTVLGEYRCKVRLYDTEGKEFDKNNKKRIYGDKNAYATFKTYHNCYGNKIMSEIEVIKLDIYPLSRLD